MARGLWVDKVVRSGTSSRWLDEANLVGGPGGVRTLDLMTASQHRLGYLVDFAARLATQEYAKARQEHSSGTDLVLIWSSAIGAILRDN